MKISRMNTVYLTILAGATLAFSIPLIGERYEEFVGVPSTRLDSLRGSQPSTEPVESEWSDASSSPESSPEPGLAPFDDARRDTIGSSMWPIPLISPFENVVFDELRVSLAPAALSPSNMLSTDLPTNVRQELYESFGVSPEPKVSSEVELEVARRTNEASVMPTSKYMSKFPILWSPRAIQDSARTTVVPMISTPPVPKKELDRNEQLITPRTVKMNIGGTELADESPFPSPENSADGILQYSYSSS